MLESRDRRKKSTYHWTIETSPPSDPQSTPPYITFQKNTRNVSGTLKALKGKYTSASLSIYLWQDFPLNPHCKNLLVMCRFPPPISFN